MKKSHDHTQIEAVNLIQHDEAHTSSWLNFSLFFLSRGILSIGDSTTQIRRMQKYVVERRRWLTQEQFSQNLSFCELLPGPNTLQLAILCAYLKRKLTGGVLAGVLFLLPGVMLMIFLSRAYVSYSQRPEVSDFLSILKPAVLGIVMGGVIKLAAAKIYNYFLAAILVASFAALSFLESSLLFILVAGGSLNLLVSLGVPRLAKKTAELRAVIISAALLVLYLAHPHWLRLSWLFLKAGLFSFGGPFATLAFLHQGAVEGYRWVSISQMLDGFTLSIALPSSLLLFSTFVGYLAGGLTGAVLATSFVFVPSFALVLVGARHMEELSNNDALQSFVAGASAAVVGALVFIVIDIAPVAFTGTATVAIAIATFLAVVLLNLDVALVAAMSVAAGIFYAIGAIGRIDPVPI